MGSDLGGTGFIFEFFELRVWLEGLNQATATSRFYRDVSARLLCSTSIRFLKAAESYVHSNALVEVPIRSTIAHSFVWVSSGS
ncbi:hypothetical protein C1H46_026391 [Malus baccata]|uniref:Uncharacterized protein n=1 Tax=Malus baccata TaxID=106549 RepID=A0A540LNN0_MALBA|nr:hypothetical protein C1H46_026389 [Malus baccata]TQD88094.1 hypothetical protein C1H46_026391 [Malus baccata]